MSDTVSVHVTSSVARELLRNLGWTHEFPGPHWRSPDGDTYWQTDEALTVALVRHAEAEPTTQEAES